MIFKLNGVENKSVLINNTKIYTIYAFFANEGYKKELNWNFFCVFNLCLSQRQRKTSNTKRNTSLQLDRVVIQNFVDFYANVLQFYSQICLQL